ncbi:unnamed protein product, partial [Prorocentrum cordatum]
ELGGPPLPLGWPRALFPAAAPARGAAAAFESQALGLPAGTRARRAARVCAMIQANPSKLKKSHIVCTMRPLRLCIEENNGDISKCRPEVEEFERICRARGHPYQQRLCDE